MSAIDGLVVAAGFSGHGFCLAGVTVWLLPLPGIPLLAIAAGVSAPQSAAAVVAPLAFVTLGSTIVTALVREARRRRDHPRLPTRGNTVVN